MNYKLANKLCSTLAIPTDKVRERALCILQVITNNRWVGTFSLQHAATGVQMVSGDTVVIYANPEPNKARDLMVTCSIKKYRKGRLPQHVGRIVRQADTVQTTEMILTKDRDQFLAVLCPNMPAGKGDESITIHAYDTEWCEFVFSIKPI